MTQILSIITFLALLFYTATEVKFQLQMMQQNTYRNDRYNRWLKGESFASVSRLVDLFLLLLLSTNFLPLFVQIVAITVALYKSVNHLKAKYKKPLVFTRRATRLYVAALLLTLIIAGLSAATTTLNNGSRALLALAILAPYLMMIANWLMQPVEKQINRKYYNEAKQILAQMPGLTIIGIDKAVLIAMAISVFDILPVLGTGGIMIPWVIVSAISGDYKLAAGLLAVYLVVTVIRNILEPKIVGSQIGLHPVVTLASMFAGVQLFGLLGLFGFPILLSLLRRLNENGTIKLFK